MQKNLFFVSFLLVYIACSLFVATTVHSADIKDRMAARIPAINVLKDQGIIGENNQGYLEFRGGSTAEEQLITEENQDRGTVYGLIGKKQGAPPKLVGERRAMMIAEKGPASHWYQKPDGTWYQK